MFVFGLGLIGVAEFGRGGGFWLNKEKSKGRWFLYPTAGAAVSNTFISSPLSTKWE